ncbi:DUF4376 domain-containing protein [Dongia soli]|uniref:DUF4376 domain-containing protein n=1 Tax=Dongia soli TaxID=600628 RepID=A0ABU5E8D6_9PROT|nr:DUF4376 domain-containing protein [Dongia soli]MDY0882319.1 DUF4376 domain-containing protein [Dongia soli]
MQKITVTFDNVGRCTGKYSGNITARPDAVQLTPEQAAVPLGLLRLVGGEVIVVEPAPPGKEAVADLLSYAATKRWQIETGGTEVGGLRIATDDRSKALIDGAKTFLDEHPAEAVDFKAESGWVTVDLPTIQVIFDALGAHIQKCFAAEKAVGLRIQSGELTTFEAVDAALQAEMNGGAA